MDELLMMCEGLTMCSMSLDEIDKATGGGDHDL